MASLHEAIIRLLVRAEVGEAVAGFKALDSAVTSTSNNASQAASQMQNVGQATGNLASGAETAAAGMTSLASTFASGLAIGVVTSALAVVGKALLDHLQNVKAVEDANHDLAISFQNLKNDIGQLNDEFSFGQKLITAYGKLKDQLPSQTTAAQIANAKDQIVKLNEALLNTEQARSRVVIKYGDVLDPKALSEKTLPYFEEEARIKEQIKKLNEEIALQGVEQLTQAKNEADASDKRLSSLLEQIKKVKDELAAPTKGPIFKLEQAAQTGKDIVTGKTVGEASIDQRILQQKIAEAIQDGIKDPANKKVWDEYVGYLQKELTKVRNPDTHAIINTELQPINAETTKAVQKYWEDSGKDLDQRMKKMPPLKPHVKITPVLENDLAGINAAIAQLGADMVTSFSEGIGQILAGGSIQNVFGNFAKVLGEGFKSIGREMIIAAPVIKALKSAIKTFNPELLLPAGIALVAIGSFLESKISQGVKFATGGIVTGPTNAIIGEAGTEVIFPLSKLNQFVRGVQGSAKNNITGTMRIQGTDIMVSLQRTIKQQNQVAGFRSINQ